MDITIPNPHFHFQKNTSSQGNVLSLERKATGFPLVPIIGTSFRIRNFLKNVPNRSDFDQFDQFCSEFDQFWLILTNPVPNLTHSVPNLTHSVQILTNSVPNLINSVPILTIFLVLRSHIVLEWRPWFGHFKHFAKEKYLIN